jgi:hypothetical protein
MSRPSLAVLLNTISGAQASPPAADGAAAVAPQTPPVHGRIDDEGLEDESADPGDGFPELEEPEQDEQEVEQVQGTAPTWQGRLNELNDNPPSATPEEIAGLNTSRAILGHLLASQPVDEQAVEDGLARLGDKIDRIARDHPRRASLAKAKEGWLKKPEPQDDYRKQLDAIPLPVGKVSEGQLRYLQELRQLILDLIERGEDPGPTLRTLRRAVVEIPRNFAREKEFIFRAIKIPKPEGMTRQQGIELEKLRCQIDKCIEAGENPEPWLEGMEARVKEMARVNARRQEFEARLDAIRDPLLATDKQIAVLNERRAEVREAIAAGQASEPLLMSLEAHVRDLPAVNAGQVVYRQQLDRLQDPPNLTSRQTVELQDQRNAILALLDEGSNPSRLIDALRLRIEAIADANAKRATNQGRLERIADAGGNWQKRLERQGVSPMLMAQPLAMRGVVLDAFEAGIDPTPQLDELEEMVKNLPEVSSKRQEWQAALKAIPTPSGLSQDKLADWEELRWKTQQQIDAGLDPEDNLRRLREQADGEKSTRRGST